VSARKRASPRRAGSLVVVGVGIRGHGHLTADARHFIEHADHVVYVVSDGIARRMVSDLRPDAESLHTLYAEGRPRERTYELMTERIVSLVREGKQVCAAFYGHPGFYADAPHDSVAQVRAEGYQAMMLPAVSSVDCLWADLGIDPADAGVQIYEATRFLIAKVKPDLAAGLILLQIGSVGELGFLRAGIDRDGLRVLADRLVGLYGPRHLCVPYEVETLLTIPRRAAPVRLADLGEAQIPYMATLWVPPKKQALVDARMVKRLGL
jgi:precorrin-6B methylase 1